MTVTSDVSVEVFSAEVGSEIQEELNRRFRESKTQDSPGEIHEAMAGLCRDVMTMLDGWVKIGKRSVFGEGCVLYWVEKFWGDLEPLHDQYDSFHDFAVQETGEEYSTFRAKIAVYRTYVLNEDDIEKITEMGPRFSWTFPSGNSRRLEGPSIAVR